MNTKITNIALVLSGGGSKGSFQFGAIKYIEEVYKLSHPDFQYTIIAGVSVGTLNGVMLAMNQYQALKGFWENISNDDVYDNYNILQILFGKRSFKSNKPLRQKLEQNVFLDKIANEYKDNFFFGAVSLTSGSYETFKPSMFSDNENFRKAILASTVMPVIWEPVGSFTTNIGSYSQSVDGGLRNVTPLGDVLKLDPDLVVMINCSKSGLANKADAGDNLLNIAKRSLTDITIDEILDTDTSEFLKINDIVKQVDEYSKLYNIDPPMKLKKFKRDGTATGEYKHFDSIIIEPPHDLGDSLEFGQALMNSRRDLGFTIAQGEFAKYEMGNQ